MVVGRFMDLVSVVNVAGSYTRIKHTSGFESRRTIILMEQLAV
jgi:hypothetical protein